MNDIMNDIMNDCSYALTHKASLDRGYKISDQPQFDNWTSATISHIILDIISTNSQEIKEIYMGIFLRYIEWRKTHKTYKCKISIDVLQKISKLIETSPTLTYISMLKQIDKIIEDDKQKCYISWKNAIYLFALIIILMIFLKKVEQFTI